MSKRKTTDRLMEEAYFHVSNGGMTVRTNQRTHQDEDRKYHYHTMNIRMGSFGVSGEFEFPILSSKHAEAFIEILNAMRIRMEGQEIEGQYGYSYLSNKDAWGPDCIYVRNGIATEYIHEERVTSQWGSDTSRIGEKRLDGKTKKLIEVIMYPEGDPRRKEVSGSGSCGGEPMYEKSDIGKLIVKGRVVGGSRLANARASNPDCTVGMSQGGCGAKEIDSASS